MSYTSPYVPQLIHNFGKRIIILTNQFFHNPSTFIGRIFLMVHEMVHQMSYVYYYVYIVSIANILISRCIQKVILHYRHIITTYNVFTYHYYSPNAYCVSENNLY